MIFRLSIVMLSGAEYLAASLPRERPFAAAQGDSGGKQQAWSLCHAEWSEASRRTVRETLRRAQGDIEKCLRLMRIGADKSAVDAINRPLLVSGVVCSSLLSGLTVEDGRARTTSSVIHQVIIPQPQAQNHHQSATVCE
jgi:hypothetical protein